MNLRKVTFAALATLPFLAGAAVAQTPKQCAAFREPAGNDTGASYVIIVTGGQVHVYWAPGLTQYQQASGGGDLTNIAHAMKDQGEHPVTNGNGGALSFPNGFGAQFEISLNGSVLTGKVWRLPAGTRYDVKGQCV